MDDREPTAPTPLQMMLFTGIKAACEAISDQLQVPVRFVGVGEQMGDLQEFHPMEFVDSLLPESFETNP